ncbi:MAG: LysR family transcriptional regulator [Cellvibrionaceae bacterium]|nr:LysR family transcriptional regulator [Cellvibrionaceae bacterium]
MSTNLRNIPLTALRAFEAVGRHCHIRRAAEEMHITHPALSRQVKQLEDYLGVELFYRKGNRLELTSAGTRFLSSVQDAFEQISKGILFLDPQSLNGELVIATTPTITMTWMLNILAVFSRRYPEIDIQMTTIDPAQKHLPMEFDLAVCLGKPDEHIRTVTKLYDEEYFPVCSPKLLSSANHKKTEDLAQYCLLHDRLNEWQAWFKKQGSSYPNTSQKIHFDHAYQAIEAARLGMGVALAEPMEVHEDIKAGRLVTAIERASSVVNSVYLVADENSKLNARTKLFLSAIFDWLDTNGATISAEAQAIRGQAVRSTQM